MKLIVPKKIDDGTLTFSSLSRVSPPEWTASSVYAAKDKVSRLGTVYAARAANVTSAPESAPGDWTALHARTPDNWNAATL